jgi:hypothetical protein
MRKLGLTSGGRLRRQAPALILLAIVALGAALRFTGLGRHFFWFDEGLLLDIDSIRHGLVRYVVRIWGQTTYNPGWAVLLWFVQRAGGDSIWIARLPSCIAGIMAIAMTYAASRGLRLDRPTALAAALLTALAWPQIEYSQQILPYAAIPLMTSVVVWALAWLARTDPRQAPYRFVSFHYVLATASIVDIVNHNSFIMLIPFLGFCLFWIWLRRRAQGQDAAAPGVVSRLRARLASPEAVAAGVTVLSIAMVALVFFMPKRGEGYRTYLDPYYLPTFRGHTMGYGPFTDTAYIRAVPQASAALDLVYFGASRAYDTYLYSVNLFSPIYVETLWGLLATAPVLMGLAGTLLAIRGRKGPAVQALGVGLILTMAGLFVLSLKKQFPFGGIRQLLFLAPLVIILAAIGWRASLRRWPLATRVLSLGCLLLYAARAPLYYQETAARMGEQQIVKAMRETGTQTVVAPEFGEHYFMLNHALRNVPKHELIDVTWPQFAALAAERKPFLLFARYAIAPGDLVGEGPGRHELAQKLKSKNLKLVDYELVPRIARVGGPFRGGQPNQGVYLYLVQPRPGVPAVASGRASTGHEREAQVAR